MSSRIEVVELYLSKVEKTSEKFLFEGNLYGNG
jgi:hypothetical protein